MTSTDAVATNEALRRALAAADRQPSLIETVRAALADVPDYNANALGLDDVARGVLGMARAEVRP